MAVLSKGYSHHHNVLYLKMSEFHLRGGQHFSKVSAAMAVITNNIKLQKLIKHTVLHPALRFLNLMVYLIQ